MKKLCIVHIGMPKTGSTSLQLSFLHGFKNNEYRYANLGPSDIKSGNHSGMMYSLFSKHSESYHYNIAYKRDKEQIKLHNDKNLALLIDGFLNTPANIELISGEDIYHLGSEDMGVAKLHAFLKEYFHKIIIVAYVRPPISLMASAFQQLVKNHKLSKFNFRSIYHPYKNFSRFDDVFGRVNVYLWKFAPATFPNGNVVLDFATRLGIELNTSTGIEENTAISQEATSILFAYNTYMNDNDINYNIKKQLINTLSNIGTTRFQFSSRLMQLVLQQNADDYNWIKQRMSESMEENVPETGIDSEEELLKFSITTIPVLKQLVGEEYLPLDIEEKTPLYVAKLVQALTTKLRFK